MLSLDDGLLHSIESKNSNDDSSGSFDTNTSPKCQL